MQSLSTLSERLILLRNEPSLENTFGGFTEGDLELPDDFDVPADGVTETGLCELDRASLLAGG
jgi:hypothetical protein